MTEPKPSVHIPVLPKQVLEFAQIESGEWWIDGTSGGGGHSLLMLEALGQHGRLLALDRDPVAVEQLTPTLPPNGVPRCASYDAAPSVIEELDWPSVDGILLDLGLSSDQLADRDRGFSFQGDGELDMRFNRDEGQPVWQWLCSAEENDIANAIFQYGEERFSRRIAKRIVEFRKSNSLRTVSQLRELIYQAVPAGRPSKFGRRHGRVDPATRTFQALRILVNEELAILENALKILPDILAAQGRLLIISFHSLEDRLVKYAFRNDERLEIVTKKPIQATEAEQLSNPRARSAKLRVARKKAAM